MGPQAKNVLREAMQLSVEERAELAADLIASVDGEPDEDADAAWAAEIERRARRARAGESQGTGWEVVRQRIQDRLPR